MLFKNSDHLEQAFLGTNKYLIQPRSGTRRQIAMGMLLYGWRKQAKTKNNFKDFLKDFFTTKDVIFKMNDPLPFFLKPLVFAHIWKESKKIGLNIPNYFTYDHDWNGESLDHLYAPRSN